MTGNHGRVDECGRAYVGSQLQIQIYVNRRSEELSRGVLSELPSLASLKARLSWVSPLEAKKFAEYQDRAFLAAVGLEHLARSLSNFWPPGGPVWDALAAVEIPGAAESNGVVLVEAKSYPREICGSGCGAKLQSLKLIEAALSQTKRWLGVAEDVDWKGRLYQSANRLAHLCFFREIVGVPAWLVNIYFLRDPRRPTRIEEWEEALPQVKEKLGLTGVDVPDTASLFLKARDRRELIGPTDSEAGDG